MKFVLLPNHQPPPASPLAIPRSERLLEFFLVFSSKNKITRRRVRIERARLVSLPKIYLILEFLSGCLSFNVSNGRIWVDLLVLFAGGERGVEGGADHQIYVRV